MQALVIHGAVAASGHHTVILLRAGHGGLLRRKLRPPAASFGPEMVGCYTSHKDHRVQGDSSPAATGNVVCASPQCAEEKKDIPVGRFGFNKRLLCNKAVLAA